MGVMGLIWIYSSFDPASGSSFFPPCPMYQLSGLKCPGCGSQRAVHALLNGEWMSAWSYNPLLMLVLPYLIVAGLAEYADIHLLGKKASDFLNSRWVIWTFFIVIMAYWVLRNIW
jgi:hypothetical protein